MRKTHIAAMIRWRPPARRVALLCYTRSRKVPCMQVVQSGRLRGIIVTGVKRSPHLPYIPTLSELGITGFEDVGGHAMWLPAGVKDIVARLHQEMVRAVQSPEVKARLEAEEAEIIANTPEQAAASIRADLDKWGEVVRKTGIRAN